jgi:hypothetical protein
VVATEEIGRFIIKASVLIVATTISDKAITRIPLSYFALPPPIFLQKGFGSVCINGP